MKNTGLRRLVACLSLTAAALLIPTLAPYLMPLVLPSLGKAHSQMQIELWEDYTHNLLERLRRRLVDARRFVSALPGSDPHRYGPTLDALARRSALVAQLRFAVTMQDLRTVILLRRQLNQEHARHRPWVRLGRGGSSTRGLWVTVWRRGWHGLLRFPVTRLVRMTALALAIGVSQASVMRGTTPAFVLTALLGFVLGLEVMEPLSQEVDQADRADAIPLDRGELLARHLFAPTVALVPFGLLAGVAAWLTLGARSDALVPIAVLCVPTVLGAATGAVISIVRDAFDASVMCRWPPVSFQTSHVSMVPNASRPASAAARAPLTLSSIHASLVPEK